MLSFGRKVEFILIFNYRFPCSEFHQQNRNTENSRGHTLAESDAEPAVELLQTRREYTQGSL